jgi:hypothetical protein
MRRPNEHGLKGRRCRVAQCVGAGHFEASLDTGQIAVPDEIEIAGLERDD